MSGCVTVTGPPAAICALKIGITLPLDPRTLPKRTVTNCVSERSLNSCTYISATRLVQPMMLDGLTALSVEIMTIFSTPCRAQASATIRVPRTLFLIASPGFSSIMGTCLCAAA